MCYIHLYLLLIGFLCMWIFTETGNFVRGRLSNLLAVKFFNIWVWYDAVEHNFFACWQLLIAFRLVIDKETGKPKGYGFCEYKDEETALSARRNLQGYEINGRQLRVDFAENGRNTDRNREKVEDPQFFTVEPFLPPMEFSVNTRSCIVFIPMNDNSCGFSNHAVSPVSLCCVYVACSCMYSYLTVHTRTCYNHPIPSLNYRSGVVPMFVRFKNASVISIFFTLFMKLACQRSWVVWQSCLA